MATDLDSALFLHNLEPTPREVAFHPGMKGGDTLVNLLTGHHSKSGTRGRHTVCLEPYGYRWYRVGGLDYLLKRTEVDPRNQT